MTALKSVYDLEVSLYHGYDHQLRDPFTDLDGKGLVSSIPAGDKQSALIIRIDQPDQISQHNAVLMSQP